MPTATLTSKGQITIPGPVREHLRLATGDRVEFRIGHDGVRLVPSGGSVDSLRGLLRRPGRRPVSVAKMDASIARVHRAPRSR